MEQLENEDFVFAAQLYFDSNFTEICFKEPNCH